MFFITTVFLCASAFYGVHCGQYQTLGCYRDRPARALLPLEGKDPILDGPYKTRNNAIEKCAQAAAKRGYTVFALQNGGWCASGPLAPKRFAMYGKSIACEDDGEGGEWANQVYVSKEYASVGCFQDRPSRAILPLEGKVSILDGPYKSRENAIAKCAVAAMSKKYKVFALQNGGWCASGPLAPKRFAMYGKSTACGDDGEGGRWANQIYVLKEYKTLGCFRDNPRGRAILPLEGKHPVLDGPYQSRKNAIAKCAAAAMSMGYKVFALQNGGWCASGPLAAKRYALYGRLPDPACKADGEGGLWSNQVYLLQ